MFARHRRLILVSIMWGVFAYYTISGTWKILQLTVNADINGFAWLEAGFMLLSGLLGFGLMFGNNLNPFNLIHQLDEVRFQAGMVAGTICYLASRICGMLANPRLWQLQVIGILLILGATVFVIHLFKNAKRRAPIPGDDLI